MNTQSMIQGAWVIPCLFYFVCVRATNDLHHFMDDFFARYKIPYQLNEEFSIKFSAEGIQNKRYIVCIPKTYLDISNKQQLDELLRFVPDVSIAKLMQYYLCTEPIGSLGYAVDYSHPQHLKKKVYFDFGKASGKGIDSYEWQDGTTMYARRTYSNWEYNVARDAQLLSKHQQHVLKKLDAFIDWPKTLCKENGKKKSLCFACKPKIIIAQLNSCVWQCVQEFYQDKKQFDAIMRDMRSYTMTWIYLQPSEVTIYYRKKDWIYYPSAKSL